MRTHIWLSISVQNLIVRILFRVRCAKALEHHLFSMHLNTSECPVFTVWLIVLFFLILLLQIQNEDVTANTAAAIGLATTIGHMGLRISLAISGTTIAIGGIESTVAVTAVTGSAYLESRWCCHIPAILRTRIRFAQIRIGSVSNERQGIVPADKERFGRTYSGCRRCLTQCPANANQRNTEHAQAFAQQSRYTDESISSIFTAQSTTNAKLVGIGAAR